MDGNEDRQKAEHDVLVAARALLLRTEHTVAEMLAEVRQLRAAVDFHDKNYRCPYVEERDNGDRCELHVDHVGPHRSREFCWTSKRKLAAWRS